MIATLIAAFGLIALVVGLLLSLVLPEQRALAWAILGIGAFQLVVSLLLEARSPRSSLDRQRTRFGLGATVESCLFVGIVVAVNAIALVAYHRFDFTGLAQFTLTAQTQDVLQSLDSPVEVVSFFRPGPTTPVKNYAANLLEEYRRNSEHITVRTVDPDLSPDLARSYGVDQLGALLGVLVFTGDEGRKRVFGPEITAEAEHAFTSAILEVTGERQKKIYFLTGHGERDIRLDYSEAWAGLRDNLFEVGEADLLRGDGVPADAASIIIAGPRQPLDEAEIEALNAYLSRGGRLLVLLDPQSFAGLQPLLGDRGIDLVQGYVFDPESHVEGAQGTPLVPRTRNALGLPSVYFPGAMAILPQEELPGGGELEPLVWSSPASWLETSRRPEANPTFDPAADRRGPLAIGILLSVPLEALDNAEQEMRLAVIGDSDFAANQHFTSANNGDLFVTVVNWLTEGVRIVSVERKPLAVRRLVLTPEEARLLHVASIGLLPLLLFGAGLVVWWRRR